MGDESVHDTVKGMSNTEIKASEQITSTALCRNIHEREVSRSNILLLLSNLLLFFLAVQYTTGQLGVFMRNVSN